MFLRHLLKACHALPIKGIPSHCGHHPVLRRDFHILSCIHRNYKSKGILPNKNSLSAQEELNIQKWHASLGSIHPPFHGVHRGLCTPAGQGFIDPSQVLNETFEQFYVMGYIKQVRFLNRLKLYQTGLTLILAPVVTYLYATSQISMLLFQAGLSISLFACGMLFVVSGLTQRVVGVLSFNEKQDIVRISHLNFFGSRSETFVDVRKVVPLSELPDDPSDLYVRLIVEGAKEPFYVSIRYARDIKKEPFQKLLGITSLD